ncbi:flagellar hook-associated protein FlgL [Pseudarthrobacter sp. B907]|uniref:flagellar hook-associated protein FlgL n=1 Tax=Pseudarthrobacter sp. B907 TaxID=3158261 RepID=UPI0032DA4EB1
MLNRVTNLTMNAAAQRSLQTQQAKLAELQDKATSLNKISRPSDDPAATAQALATRSLLAANAQYGRNIDDGNTWLTAADSALEQATNVMRRVKDLTVMAGNGSLNQSGKDAIAAELESLNKDLVSIANTQHLGRNVFAGSSDAAGAFTPGTPRNPSVPSDAGTPPTFNGTGISSVERRISATQTVRVDADGAEIFGNGAGSVFDTVSKLAADLRTGTDVAPRVADVDTAFKKIVNGRAEIGTRQAQLERAGNVNTELEASLDAQRTGIEKADLGSVIMDLKLQETNYQVALAATARVLQPTLMDFLR